MPSAVIPEATTLECRGVEFRLVTTPGLRVAVVGSFNEWDPERHPLPEAEVGGLYRLVLRLPPGEYEYRFVVGDGWRQDKRVPDLISQDYVSATRRLVVR